MRELSPLQFAEWSGWTLEEVMEWIHEGSEGPSRTSTRLRGVVMAGHRGDASGPVHFCVFDEEAFRAWDAARRLLLRKP